MMTIEQRAKRILDFLAKRVGYVCCKLGEPQPNGLNQAMMRGEVDMIVFPLALRDGEPKGYQVYLTSNIKGFVKAVFPISKLPESLRIKLQNLKHTDKKCVFLSIQDMWLVDLKELQKCL